MIPPRISKEPWAAIQILAIAIRSVHATPMETYPVRRERTNRPGCQLTEIPNLSTVSIQSRRTRGSTLLNPITRPSRFHSSKYGGSKPALRRMAAMTPTTRSGQVTPLLYGIYQASSGPVHHTNSAIKTNPQCQNE